MKIGTIVCKLAVSVSEEIFAFTLVAFDTRLVAALNFHANIVDVHISTFGLELAKASLKISAYCSSRPCHF